MTYLTVDFNEERERIEIKISIPLVLSRIITKLYLSWRSRSGRAPFSGEDFLLSERAREDLGLRELLSERDRVWMRHPARF